MITLFIPTVYSSNNVNSVSKVFNGLKKWNTFDPLMQQHFSFKGGRPCLVVVGSNPGFEYWMDFFSHIIVKSKCLFEKTDNKR